MDSGMDREIGREIKAMRLEAGITQQRIAAALGKPQSYVSKVESAKRDLHLSEIADYADAIGKAERGKRRKLVAENKLSLEKRRA